VQRYYPVPQVLTARSRVMCWWLSGYGDALNVFNAVVGFWPPSGHGDNRDGPMAARKETLLTDATDEHSA
jgi:hypothetical protein